MKLLLISDLEEVVLTIVDTAKFKRCKNYSKYASILSDLMEDVKAADITGNVCTACDARNIVYMFDVDLTEAVVHTLPCKIDQYLYCYPWEKMRDETSYIDSGG